MPVLKRKVRTKDLRYGFRVATFTAKGVAILIINRSWRRILYLLIEELVAIIREAKEKFGIEGVTYSEGEPMLQQNISVLTDKIHELGLGVISFTGRQFEDVKEILGNRDVVLDGNYDDSRPETKRRLLGSTNQRIISLTNRYDETSLQWFFSGKKEIEINTGKAISFNGDHF